MSGRQAVIDIGKSGIRGAFTSPHGTTRVEEPGGISPGTSGDQGAVLATRILGMLDRAGAPSDLQAIVVGCTAELTTEEDQALAQALQARCPVATVAIGDDGVLAHGLLLDGPGILLAVGTGVIAIGRGEDDSLSRADGWGPLLGDRGGAVDVGRNGLRVALADQDGGRASALRKRALARFGLLDTLWARQLTAAAEWPEMVASFARDVAALASDGDADAIAIIDEAASELVRTATIAAAKAKVRRIAVTGRFAHLRPLAARLEEPLRHAGLQPVSTRTPLESLDAGRFIVGPYRAWLRIWEPG